MASELRLGLIKVTDMLKAGWEGAQGAGPGDVFLL